MLPEISRSRKRLGIRAVVLMLVHVSAQDGFTQTTRVAVNQHSELLFAETELFERTCVQYLLENL